MVEMRPTLNHWLHDYLKLNMDRNESLFTQFLPIGYIKTTLSCVHASFYDLCQLTKWMLGLLITLTDDFTDNPKFRSTNWVNAFIAAVHGGLAISSLSDQQQQALKLACQLYEAIKQSVAQMILQPRLISLIEFDLEHYFLNMRFSALINNDPLLISKREYLWHAPHNMGIVLAGMIDLACSDTIVWQEIAVMRELFYCAQRSGHICNTLTTYNRELEEGCSTNEIQLRQLHKTNKSKEKIIEFLKQERADLYQKISKHSLKTFSIKNYVQGLMQLQILHEEMQGEI